MKTMVKPVPKSIDYSNEGVSFVSPCEQTRRLILLVGYAKFPTRVRVSFSYTC